MMKFATDRTYYLALKAYDNAGNESEYSEEQIVHLLGIPMPPSGIKITIEITIDNQQ